MNKRIEELAYQAEDYADSIVDQGGEFHPAYTRKFAELLIDECCTALEHTERHRRDYFIAKIREHFEDK